MSKKTLVITLVMIWGLAVSALAQSGATKNLTQHSSTAYRLEVATEGDKPITMDYQEQGGKVRLAVQVPASDKGKEGKMEMIQLSDAMFILNAEGKSAVKFGGKNNPMANSMFPFMAMVVEPDWSTYQAAHAQGYSVTDKGTETIRGMKCKTKEFNNLQGKDKVVLYISDDNMIRRWVVTPGQPGAKKSSMDLISLEFDKKIPDTVFQVPAGYQIQDMSNMPMMPGMGTPPAQKRP